MKIKSISVFLFHFLILTFSTAWAQEIKFQASVSKNPVAVGEAFRLTFTINAQTNRISPPDLSKFDLVSGPNQSSNAQITNAGIIQNIQLSYVLMAKQEGKFLIGAASANIANGLVKSNEINLTVKGKVAPQNQQQQQRQNPYQYYQQPQQQEQAASNAVDNIYIKAIVSKNRVYQGEQFSVIYKLYSKYNAVSFSDIKFPSFSGFYSEELAVPKNIEFVRETINGQVWLTAVIKKSLLMAQKPGKLEIPSLEMQALVRERTNSRDIFEQMFGGGFRDINVKLKSKPLSIEVDATPNQGKPASYTGAAGDFNIEATIDKNKLKANDAATLKITLSGKGGFKLIDNLAVNMIDEIEMYEPQIKDKLVHSESGSSGSRIFEYLLIPKTGGNFEIGPFQFSYFSPTSKSYKTISTEKIVLEVERSKNDTYVASKRKGDVKTLSEDVSPIFESNIQFYESDQYFFIGTGYFYSISAIPPVIFLIILTWRRRKNLELANSKTNKIKKANQVTLKRLKQAQNLAQGSSNEFNQAVLDALYGYLQDKFQLNKFDLNSDQIKAVLQKNGVEDKTMQEWMTIISNCEMAKYSPVSQITPQKVLDNAAHCLNEIENQLKNTIEK
jgi:hypothetical protein